MYVCMGIDFVRLHSCMYAHMSEMCCNGLQWSGMDCTVYCSVVCSVMWCDVCNVGDYVRMQPCNHLCMCACVHVWMYGWVDSMYVHACMSMQVHVCTSLTSLSIRYLPIYAYVHLLSSYLSNHLPICLPICLPTDRSMYLSIYLSTPVN